MCVFVVDDVPQKKCQMPKMPETHSCMHTYITIAKWCVFAESCQLGDVILLKSSFCNMHKLMCQCGVCESVWATHAYCYHSDSVSSLLLVLWEHKKHASNLSHIYSSYTEHVIFVHVCVSHFHPHTNMHCIRIIHDVAAVPLMTTRYSHHIVEPASLSAPSKPVPTALLRRMKCASTERVYTTTTHTLHRISAAYLRN